MLCLTFSLEQSAKRRHAFNFSLEVWRCAQFFYSKRLCGGGRLTRRKYFRVNEQMQTRKLEQIIAAFKVQYGSGGCDERVKDLKQKSRGLAAIRPTISGGQTQSPPPHFNTRRARARIERRRLRMKKSARSRFDESRRNVGYIHSCHLQSSSPSSRLTRLMNDARCPIRNMAHTPTPKLIFLISPCFVVDLTLKNKKNTATSAATAALPSPPMNGAIEPSALYARLNCTSVAPLAVAAVAVVAAAARKRR